jgi:hypothetical protein
MLQIIGGLVLVGLISHRKRSKPRVTVGGVLKEEAGVTVSVNPVEGFEMGELVATGEFAASPKKVAAILWDMNSYPEWMPRVRDVDTLNESDTKRLDYFVFEAPGGGRDVISEAQKSEADGKYLIKFKQKEGVKYAPKESLTRLTLRQGSWELSPTTGGSTLVKYRLRADPGVTMSTKMLQNLAAKGILSLFAAIRSEVK